MRTCQLYVPFSMLLGSRCYSDNVETVKCSKARNISVIEFDNMAWLPPIQHHKCAFFFCLVKPHSGALKSRRTPGTPSLREGYGGCGEGEKQEGRVSLCQTQNMSRPRWQTHTNRSTGEMSKVVCCLTLWWQTGHKQIEGLKFIEKQTNHPLMHTQETSCGNPAKTDM